MRIATWNVNSVRARMESVTHWLKVSQPDILLLQEIKCESKDFPAFEFKALGYESLVVGQKSYNGVAVLSKKHVQERTRSLEGDAADLQARYLEVEAEGCIIACLYLPNGNPVGTEKWAYKLDWMRRLKTHMAKLWQDEKPVILGGDFNVLPTAKDVYDPAAWREDALFRPETRSLWQEIKGIGYADAFRLLHPEDKAYSFWDYQAGSWPQDKGLRIDHFLVSPEACDRLNDVFIDKEPRGWEKASDHTPVILDITLCA